MARLSSLIREIAGTTGTTEENACAIARKSRAATAILGLDGHVKAASRSACGMFGVHGGASWPHMRDFLGLATPTDCPAQETVLSATRLNGSRFACMISGTAMATGNDSAVYVVHFVDLSDAETAHDIALESAEACATALRAIPRAAYYCDRMGRVVLANTAGTAFLGIDDPRGYHLTRFLPAALAITWQQHLDRAAVSVSATGFAIDSPGRGYPAIEVEIDPIRSAPGCAVVAFLVVFQPGRRNARIPDAPERLGRKNQALLLARASHDMRQPLQAIMLWADELGSESGNLSAPAQEALKAMTGASMLLRHLVLGALDMTSLILGRIEPNIVHLRLDQMLPEVCGFFREEAARKGVDLVVECPGMVTKSDPVMLGRMVSNLLCNAVRHTPSGKISVTATPENGMARITVKDTGTGMNRDDLEKLLSGDTRQPSTRRGFGLEIVKQMGISLGHGVDASSVVGVGSEFSLLVPLIEARADRPVRCASCPTTLRNRMATGLAAPSGAAECGPCAAATMADPATECRQPAADAGNLAGTHKLLVVDDDDMVRESMSRYLARTGFDVLAAAGAASAMALVTGLDGKPLIAMSDYLLDGDNGINLIQAVRSLRAEPVPGFLLTGVDTPELLEEATSAGIVLLKKPITGPELHAALIGTIRASIGV